MTNGNLDKRIKLCASRLLSDIYDYPYVLEKKDEWPGDYPGRTILALTSLYLSLDESDLKTKIKERIDIIYSNLEEYLNEDCFFGPIFNPNEINEQQLSGNSWYIRGLCRYYEINKDPKVIEMLNSIAKRLLIPLSRYYETYPIYSREESGEVSGHLIKGNSSSWVLSSDVGCAFILLDGYVSTYEILRDKRLEEAIKNIIKSFEKIDFLSLMCQTHATLTATRAILRFYSLAKDEYYLNLVIKIFDLYLKEGMSDDYENINWLRKDGGFTWTEPCCVIDSIILSKHLYLLTKDNKYLRLLNKIYVNGVRTFQRDNGGAGCTSIIRRGIGEMKAWMYEAYFCCTLREGEGFYELSNAFLKKDNKYTFLIDEGMEDSNVTAQIDLYDKKIIRVYFKNDAEISLYVPTGFKSSFETKDNFIEIAGKKGETISIDFDLEINKDGLRYLYGDMLLTKKDKHFGEIFKINGEEYSLLYDSSRFDEETLSTLVQKI